MSPEKLMLHLPEWLAEALWDTSRTALSLSAPTAVKLMRDSDPIATTAGSDASTAWQRLAWSVQLLATEASTASPGFD